MVPTFDEVVHRRAPFVVSAIGEDGWNGGKADASELISVMSEGHHAVIIDALCIACHIGIVGTVTEKIDGVPGVSVAVVVPW